MCSNYSFPQTKILKLFLFLNKIIPYQNVLHFLIYHLFCYLILTEKRQKFFSIKKKNVLRSAISISFTNLNEQKNYFFPIFFQTKLCMRPLFQ